MAEADWERDTSRQAEQAAAAAQGSAEDDEGASAIIGSPIHGSGMGQIKARAQAAAATAAAADRAGAHPSEPAILWPSFFTSVFELVDTWTETATMIEYIEMMRVSFREGPKPLHDLL